MPSFPTFEDACPTSSLMRGGFTKAMGEGNVGFNPTFHLVPRFGRFHTKCPIPNPERADISLSCPLVQKESIPAFTIFTRADPEGIPSPSTILLLWSCITPEQHPPQKETLQFADQRAAQRTPRPSSTTERKTTTWDSWKCGCTHL